MLCYQVSTFPTGGDKPGRPFKQRVLRLEICTGKTLGPVTVQQGPPPRSCQLEVSPTHTQQLQHPVPPSQEEDRDFPSSFFSVFSLLSVWPQASVLVPSVGNAPCLCDLSSI